MSDSPSIQAVPPASPRFGKALALFLLLLLAVIGVREGFKFAKLHLALKHAHREFSTRQFMRAEFWTGRALGVDEKNIEALRLMAEINEAQDRAAALEWRIKVVQGEPANAADMMALAKCALRFGKEEMTLSVLKNLPEDFKNKSAEFQELMGGCALADHETSLAEAYFVKAEELDHGNPLYRVNVEAFRLANSQSPEVRAGAARELEGLLADPRAGVFAARALLSDAVRSKEPARAQKFADKLRSLPEHNFGDDLACLEAAMSGPTFHPALEDVERRAESDASRTTMAGDWLNSHGMAAETLRWLAGVPATIQSNVRVQMTVAEAYLALSDWNGLETFLAKCHWDKGEFLRSAMLVRCKRELSQPWGKEWKTLLVEVETTPPDSLLLAHLVAGWRWRDETIDLLWEAASEPGSESKALQYLWDLYSRTNETSKLWRVAQAQIKLDPSNPAKKNNAAFLSLLLYGASERSERLAREASNANPKVPEWAATYAYALHLGGKEPESKKVMEKLSPEALGRPGIALYYAIVLAANGDNAKAKEFLAKLNPNGMLPEERKLAADLAQRLNVASR